MPPERGPWYNPYNLQIHTHLAVYLWGGLLVVVLFLALYKPQGHTVYPIFANAGKTWSQGGDIYGDKRAQLDLDFFRYSPPVASFFAPMSKLPLGLGGFLWRGLNAVVFLVGLRWWFRSVLPSTLTRDHFGWILLFLLPVSAASFHNGQSNPLMIGLILATTAAVAEKRWLVAATAVVFASVLKVYPLSFALLIAVAFPRPFAWRLALMLVLVALLPFLTQRPDYVVAQYQEWVHYLRTDVRKHVSFDRSYRDLRFLFRAWGGKLDDQAYLALQLFGGGIGRGDLARGVAQGVVGPSSTHSYFRTCVDLDDPDRTRDRASHLHAARPEPCVGDGAGVRETLARCARLAWGGDFVIPGGYCLAGNPERGGDSPFRGVAVGRGFDVSRAWVDRAGDGCCPESTCRVA